jgi:RNA polymerase sigma-70 factor (ECF subfamily)
MDRLNTINQAIKGDDNAFYELIQERKATLYKTAYAYVKNKDDAMDIIGETVYRAYISIGKLREPDFFNTWLTRILINSSIDYIKKNKKVIPSGDEINTSKVDNICNSEINMDLYNAIDKLQPKFKTIIILKYFQDLTIPQIADILQYPVGTVKTYLNKALKELRIDLKEEFSNDPA